MKLYEQAQAEAAGNGDTSWNQLDDDVVDAEFEEVNDDKDK